jgi:hypothetical protein
MLDKFADYKTLTKFAEVLRAKYENVAKHSGKIN